MEGCKQTACTIPPPLIEMFSATATPSTLYFKTIIERNLIS